MGDSNKNIEIKFNVAGKKYKLPYIPDKKCNTSGENANIIFSYDNRYAAKVLKRINDEEKYNRFKNEINESENIRRKYPEAVIPILYSHLPSLEDLKNSNDICYYIMPKCKKIDIVKDFNEYIKLLLDVADSLDKIHKCRYAHRDIKKSNILNYNGKWILSDYGCIFPYEFERISGNGEKVGPEGSPEELFHIDAIKNKKKHIYLYQSSDCFLFAKMIWHLVCGGELFHGSLKKGDLNYKNYIDEATKKFGEQLILPLLEIMEETIIYETKYWKKRLSLVDIINKLKYLKCLTESKNEEYYNCMMKQKLLFVSIKNDKTYSSYNDNNVFNDVLSGIKYPHCFKIDKLYFVDGKLEVVKYDTYDKYFIFKNEITNVIFHIEELKIYEDMSKIEIVTKEIKNEDYDILQRQFNNPRYNNIVIRRKTTMWVDI